MTSKGGLLAVAVGLTLALTADIASAASKNWMREYIELRKQAMLERAIGVERGATLRAAKGLAPRIVGGTTASNKANPFQVALLFAAEPNNAQAQYCGGTLYKPNVVVTAAHCSDFVTPNQVRVLTGTRRLDGTGTRRKVSSIIVHPDWNPATFDSDVAVWILSSFASGIELAKLVRRTEEPTKDKTLVTGWGDTEDAGFPIDLMQVIVPLQPKRDCNDADSYDGAITNNMICAGRDAGGTDSCQGDSGGPLTTRPAGVDGGVGNYDILTGITSWGVGCADPELFGVYTRVAKFRDWIEQQVP